jgi:hypothetical protein
MVFLGGGIYKPVPFAADSRVWPGTSARGRVGKEVVSALAVRHEYVAFDYSISTVAPPGSKWQRNPLGPHLVLPAAGHEAYWLPIRYSIKAPTSCWCS